MLLEFEPSHAQAVNYIPYTVMPKVVAGTLISRWIVNLLPGFACSTTSMVNCIAHQDAHQDKPLSKRWYFYNLASDIHLEYRMPSCAFHDDFYIGWN